MRVAVDARHLGRGRGIARYLEAMLGALAGRHGEAEWVAVVPDGGATDLPEGVTAVESRAPARLSNACAALLGRPRLDVIAGGADVVWIPAPAPVAWSSGVPAVLTVHDISWEERPSDFTPYERAWHAAARPRRLAARAARVACVSEATHEAILGAGWPVAPGQTVVIPEAPTLVPSPATEASQPPEPGRYLLFVGALEPRKGIEALAAGLAEARLLGLELPLVVVGDGRLRGRLAPLPGVRLVSGADDAQLTRLYAGATALVAPSMLEGFGLPPVEAAAFGVPSVASDLPALRESLGQAFLAVPPGDSAALGEAMFSISTDLALRNRLGEQARERVGRLSWARSADRLFSLLLELGAEPAR